MNVNRRHLDESQRAMVAAELANLGPGNPSGANQHIDGTAPIDAVPKAEAAEKLGIGAKSVDRAKAVLASGIQPLIDMCKRDRLAVSLAPRG